MQREGLAVRARLLARVITRLYDEQLRPLGLTAAQLDVLCLVVAGQSTTVATLAGTLQMEASAVGEVVGALERDGRLERGEGERLTATRDGRRTLADAMPAWKRAQHAAADLLGPTGTRAITSHGVYTALW